MSATETSSGSVRPRPQLEHVGFWAKDAQALARFYENVLGLTVSDEGVHPVNGRYLIFMTANPEAHHQLVLAQATDEDPEPMIQQISFRVESIDELREIDNRAKEAGIESMPRDHGNAWSVYFPDPEGNRLEIYANSPFYVHQPHSRPLDLSLSDEDIISSSQEAMRDDETFKSREEWLAEIRQKMA